MPLTFICYLSKWEKHINFNSFMYPINDRQYLKICAEIAKLMSISLSSAKKKVEIEIAKEGSKTIQEKIQVAQNVLKIVEKMMEIN